MTSSSPSEGGSGPTRPPRRHPRRGIGLALLTMLVQTVGTTIAARGQAAELDLLGLSLLAASGLALTNRHRFPRVTTVAIAAMTVSYHVLDYPRGPTLVALIIAAVVALKAGRHRLVWVTAIVSYAAWVVLAGATGSQALTLAAWAVGLGLLAEAVLGAARMGARMVQEQRRLRGERQRRQASGPPRWAGR